MIDYVVEHNPDHRVLRRASEILRSGGLVCFPTESNWVAVADPFNSTGVGKLYSLRHVDNTKHFTVMCPSFQKAMEIAFISDSAFSLMKRVTPGSYTFILNAQKKITKHLKASKHDHQVGIRFPPRKLCRFLLDAHGDILLSSHISADMLDLEEGSLIYSALIEEHFGGKIDLIIDPGEVEFSGQTTIVDFTEEAPEVLRIGCGDPSLFLR
jgi:tRNA threonylcarbamoyl adenosine modification protein (Sua5/YciO/YrdC/YwlC family)